MSNVYAAIINYRFHYFVVEEAPLVAAVVVSLGWVETAIVELPDVPVVVTSPPVVDVVAPPVVLGAPVVVVAS